MIAQFGGVVVGYGNRRRKNVLSALALLLLGLLGFLAASCQDGLRSGSALTFQVMDHYGRPVAGAFVEVHGDGHSKTTHTDYGNAVGRAKEFVASRGVNMNTSLQSNARGEATVDVGNAVGVVIKADGYSPLRQEWQGREQPKDPVVVTLLPDAPSVPMLEFKGPRLIWTEPVENVGAGIDFDCPIDDVAYGMTEEKERAEVWIEAAKSAGELEASTAGRDAKFKSLTRLWRMRVTALKGWQLAAAPGDPYTNLIGEWMHLAPQSGYVETIEYRADEFPQGIYVRGPDGQRFGRFADFRFEQDAYATGFLLMLQAEHIIQVESTGSRSLLPTGDGTNPTGSSTVEPATLQSVLQGAFSKATVHVQAASKGTMAAEDGRSVPFAIHSSLVFQLAGEPYVAAVLSFVSEEATYLKALGDHNDALSLPSPALVIVGSVAEPKESRTVAIDPRAACLCRGRLSVENLVGLDQPQLRLNAELLYTKTPEIYTSARRFFVYGLPKLDELVATTLYLNHFRNGATHAKRRTLEFLDAGPGQPRHLFVNDQVSETDIELAFQNGRYGYREDETWDPDEMTQSTAKLAPDFLCVRIIDPQGRPIPRAQITGMVSEPSVLDIVTWKERDRKKTVVMADETGEAKLKLGFGLSVGVKAGGFLDGSASWRPSDLPPDSVSVTLTPLPKLGPILEYQHVRQTWNCAEGPTEFGIDFDAPETDSEQGKTGDRQRADVWIQTVKSAEEGEAIYTEWADQGVSIPMNGPNQGKMDETSLMLREQFKQLTSWHLRVTGLNGNTLAVGATKSPWSTYGTQTVDAAPEAGYVEQLEFRPDLFPQKVFVRNSDGKRYAMLAPVQLYDPDRWKGSEYTVGVKYAAQKKGTGSRSFIINGIDARNPEQ